MDGSDHHWLGDQCPRLVLIAAIDGASVEGLRLVIAGLREEE